MAKFRRFMAAFLALVMALSLTGLTALADDDDIPGNAEEGNGETVAVIDETEYESIGAAIVEAQSGDTVTVMSSTTENIVINKDITLDLNGMTLSGDGTASVIIVGQDATVTIKNGTVTGGYGSALGEYADTEIFNSVGGGIQNSGNLTVEGVTVTGNTAGENGGGIYSHIGSIEIKNCEITNNVALDNGGGIYAGYSVAPNNTVTISGTTVSRNAALLGAGIYCADGVDDTVLDVSIDGCTVSYNNADQTDYMSGGGMFIEIFVDAEITNTSIDHNISTIGGGIYAYGNVTLDSDTTVSSNTATGAAGGILASRLGARSDVAVTINGAVIEGNTAPGGAGIYGTYGNIVMNSGVIRNNTATTGSGGGVYLYYGSGFTMNGGSITGNTAANGSGGGVNVYDYVAYISSTNTLSKPVLVESGRYELYIDSETYGTSRTMVKADDDNKAYDITDSELRIGSYLTMNAGVIDNNTAGVSGDDVYSTGGESSVTLADIADGETLTATGESIDGWYYDGYYADSEGTVSDARWSEGADGYQVKYTPAAADTDTLALKAAYAYVEPENPEPENPTPDNPEPDNPTPVNPTPVTPTPTNPDVEIGDDDVPLGDSPDDVDIGDDDVPLGAAPEDEWDNPYSDVQEGKWYYDAVKYVTKNSLFSGDENGNFLLGTKLTRGMLAQVIYNAEGKPEVSGASSFFDVESSKWYTDAISWAASNKIVSGYGDGNFGPNDDVTREQMVLILYNYAKFKGYDVSATADITTFVDGGDTSSWAQTSIQWAVGAGIMSGKDGNRLDPKGTATREEAAQLIMNFCNLTAAAEEPAE